MILLIFLSGCGEDPSLGTPGFVEGFAGGVVADEPQAALVGQDVLSAGGLAGDAAAAVFFSLAATKPATAGLMASGHCVAFDPDEYRHTGYRFAPPAGSRAMAAIHARFGVLPWRQVVGPAESLARFGFRLSKAFVADWQAANVDNEAVHRIYGGSPAIGQEVENLDLAGLLGQMRINGAGAFYTGLAAQRMWTVLESEGLSVDRDAWRNAVPQTADSTLLPFGNHELAVPPFEGSAGSVLAGIWPAVEEDDPSSVPQRLAEQGVSASAEGLAETAFVAVDRLGGSVACVLSLGEPFGLGRLVNGVFLAEPSPPSTAPVLLTNRPTNVLLASIAGTNAPGMPAAMVMSAFRGPFQEQESLENLVTAPRILPAGDSRFLAEPGADIPGDIPAGTVERAEGLGRVSGIVCARGLPNYAESCTAAADPRGHGFAALADVPR
ncbi:MAG TPA: gamma-glutamyltransferase [Alphaproteobacteria bacterium]|nr:gamma-glutamyltransferase [Alphaproteobacteria bacterium]